jgi:hypothetical protein
LGKKNSTPHGILDITYSKLDEKELREGTMSRKRALKAVLVVVGLDLFRFSLSLDDVCAARACVGDDA